MAQELVSGWDVLPRIEMYTHYQASALGAQAQACIVEHHPSRRRLGCLLFGHLASLTVDALGRQARVAA